MLDFFQNLHWAALFQIVVIDILLGGDNAVVIALACRHLQPHQRLHGVIWGTAGAIVLRLVLVGFALVLLTIPFLKLAGGLLLFWIGVKLLRPDDSDATVSAGSSVWSAVKTILVADFVMSLDNVIAIAGAAQNALPDHQMAYVVFGLLLSVPIIVWGSTLLLKLIDRFPLIVTFGAALLGWIAGGMVITDAFVVDQMGSVPSPVKLIAEVFGALLVIAVGKWLAARRAS